MPITLPFHRRQRRGYIFLISVLAIGIISTMASASLLLLAWAAEQNGLNVQRVHQAQENALTCIERTIDRLRKDPTYGSGETIEFTNGSCVINGIDGDGYQDRSICVTGSIANAIFRRMEVDIQQLYPSVVIRTWREVPSFALCSDA